MSEHLTDADFGYPAWASFVTWALDQPDMRAQFEVETGKKFMPPPKNAIDAMIDKATGANTAVLNAFILWVTDVHYGAEYAPPKVQAAIAAQNSGAVKAGGDHA